MHKKLLISILITAMFSVIIAAAHAQVVTVTQSPTGDIGLNQPVTITATTMLDGPVTFEWYNPSNFNPTTLMPTGPATFTNPNVALVGIPGSASSTQSPNALGQWLILIKVSGQTIGVRQVWVWYTINVIPEIPLIGTAGAAVAMIAGVTIAIKKKPFK